MPICKTIIVNDSTTVKVWRITESISDLLTDLQLSEYSKTKLERLKHESAKKCFLSARRLLLDFGINDSNLFYNEDGKPFLKNGRYVSITHSKDIVAVVVSDLDVGVDVQDYSEKLLKVKSKFIGVERLYLKEDFSLDIKRLTMIWTVKEALFKANGKKGLNFRDDFMVLPFTEDSEKSIGWILNKCIPVKFNVSFFNIEDFSLSVVLKN